MLTPVDPLMEMADGPNPIAPSFLKGKMPIVTFEALMFESPEAFPTCREALRVVATLNVVTTFPLFRLAVKMFAVLKTLRLEWTAVTIFALMMFANVPTLRLVMFAVELTLRVTTFPT